MSPAAASMAASRRGPRDGVLPYVDVFRLGFVETLAYRSQIWMRLVLVPLTAAFQYFIFAALYASGPEVMGGHRLTEIAGYVALMQTLRTLFANNISIFIGEAIRTGQIATYLLRPLAFPWFAMSYIAGRGASQVFTMGVPTLIGFALVGALPAPPDAGTFVAFLLLTLAAFLLYNLAFTMAGLIGFFVEFSGELAWSVELVLMLLGGATIPLSFFPAWLARPLELLPTSFIYYVPAEAYLGRIGGPHLVGAVVIAWTWVVLGFLGVRRFYELGRRHISIQGG